MAGISAIMADLGSLICPLGLKSALWVSNLPSGHFNLPSRHQASTHSKVPVNMATVAVPTGLPKVHVGDEDGQAEVRVHDVRRGRELLLFPGVT